MKLKQLSLDDAAKLKNYVEIGRVYPNNNFPLAIVVERKQWEKSSCGKQQIKKMIKESI